MGICVSCRRRERKAPEKRSGAGLGAGGPGKGPAAAELLPRRVDHLPAMANSISNIKMTNPIKGIVSKRRKRYIKDGFNLDLAYITDRLIAMGFPAEKLEGVYRNHIDEVYRFLEQMHKDHYKIYNLCSERSYDSSKFHERVERYAFEDHTPPNMELIQPFCEDVHSWLSADSRNVAAVHCKAGKGRTGTMVCCYLLYSGQKATADEALQFYGTKRTHDEKGVTIPSQRRYVEYYAELVRSNLQYTATKVYIRELIMCPPPMLNGGQCTLELTVSQAQPPFKAPHGCHEVRKHARCVRVCLTHCTPLHGDVRVDVYNKPKMMMRKEKLFHFWFNTFFLVAEVGAQRIPPPPDSPNQETYKLTLNKWQLDDAHKDKQHKLYSPDFKVELIVQKQPDTSTFSAHPPRAPSPPSSSASSASEPDTEPDAHWDSGEAPPSTQAPQPCSCRGTGDSPPAAPERDRIRTDRPPAQSMQTSDSKSSIECDENRCDRRSHECQYRATLPLQGPTKPRLRNINTNLPPGDIDDPLTRSRECSYPTLPRPHSYADIAASTSYLSTTDSDSSNPSDMVAIDIPVDYDSALDRCSRSDDSSIHPYELLTDDPGVVYNFPDDLRQRDSERTLHMDCRPSSDPHPYELLSPKERKKYDMLSKSGDDPLAFKLLTNPNLDSEKHPYDLHTGNGHAKSIAFKLLPPNTIPPTYEMDSNLPEKEVPSSRHPYDLLPDKDTVEDPPPAYKLLPDKSRPFNKPRLSLTDVKASWKEFSGKFSEHKKKRDKE